MSPAAPRPRLALRLVSGLSLGIEGIAAVALALLGLVPLVDLLLARVFGVALAERAGLVEQSLIVLAFASAAVASRNGAHLALTAPDTTPAEGQAAPERGAGLKARLDGIGRAVSRLVEAGGTIAFFWASLSLLVIGFDSSEAVAGIPLRAFAAVLPLGFLVMALESLARPGKAARWCALAGILAGTVLGGSAIAHLAEAAGLGGGLGAALAGFGAATEAAVTAVKIPLIAFIILSTFVGAPIFSVLGSLAVVLLPGIGDWIEYGPQEAYSLLRGASLAALPLFALVGFILTESGAGKRLVAIFRALFGWFPGGEAFAAVLVSAFFTTFTGASGVTIIALGGLLAGILVESGYPESQARGLVTASGAIGLLLPPSAAVILYSVNAQFIYGQGATIDMNELFLGAIVPGLLLVLAMGLAGTYVARKRGARGRPFDAKAARLALKPALLELLTPVLLILVYFTGFANLVESAAIAVVYLAVVEGLVKKELGLRGLLSAIRKSLPILGGTLAILAAARALSFYLIDADVPGLFAAWVEASATSPFLFLLLLNIALLGVGCIMDIYSAIIIAAPLVIPLGAAFGLSPIHLGVVFILNLCLGFLTPPVGMSLFLAGYAFKKPLGQVVRETMPYFLIQLAILILVTWIPDLTTFLIKH